MIGTNSFKKLDTVLVALGLDICTDSNNYTLLLNSSIDFIMNVLLAL